MPYPPPPPPPPLGGPPPPPPLGMLPSNSKGKSTKSHGEGDGGSRDALLKSIQKGRQLKKVGHISNDRSGPHLNGASSKNPAPISSIGGVRPVIPMMLPTRGSLPVKHNGANISSGHAPSFPLPNSNVGSRNLNTTNAANVRRPSGTQTQEDYPSVAKNRPLPVPNSRMNQPPPPLPPSQPGRNTLPRSNDRIGHGSQGQQQNKYLPPSSSQHSNHTVVPPPLPARHPQKPPNRCTSGGGTVSSQRNRHGSIEMRRPPLPDRDPPAPIQPGRHFPSQVAAPTQPPPPPRHSQRNLSADGDTKQNYHNANNSQFELHFKFRQDFPSPDHFTFPKQKTYPSKNPKNPANQRAAPPPPPPR